MYEAKFKYKIVTDDMKQKTLKGSLLVEALDVLSAAATAMADLSCEYQEAELMSVSWSTIREVGNPNQWEEDIPAWTITLESQFVSDTGAVKKTRYPILLWSDTLPKDNEGTLRDYLQGVDPAGNTFSVVKITKSPIVKVV